MQNIDESAESWRTAIAENFGKSVEAARKAAGLTAVELAKRTKEYGHPISRVAVTKIENNKRAGKVDLAEVISLALALGIPPVQLLYPELPDGKVEVWPGVETTSIEALQWFSGHIAAWMIDRNQLTLQSTNTRVQLARQYYNAEKAMRHANVKAIEARVFPVAEDMSAEDAERRRTEGIEEAERRHADAKAHFARIRDEILEAGWPVDDA